METIEFDFDMRFDGTVAFTITQSVVAFSSALDDVRTKHTQLARL